MQRFTGRFLLLFLLAGMVSIAKAQPGPFTTLRNSNLTFNASLLLTNGLPGLTGPAANLMVFSVLTNSSQTGQVALLPATLWGRRYIGPGNYYDQPTDVALDSAGNVLVTGNSYGVGSSDDFATIKYSAAGTALWTNRFNGMSNSADGGIFVAVDSADNVYVTGKSDNSSTIVTLKYDPNGAPIWTNWFSAATEPYWVPAGFAVDPAGNVYLSAADFAGSALGYVLIKYVTTGEAAWTNYFIGSGGLASSGPIALDDSGNIFVTGWDYTSGGQSACATLKYSGDGTCLWTNRFLIAGSENGGHLTVDKAGSVYVSGDSQGGVPQHIYFTIKYNNDGVPIWTNIQAAPAFAQGGIPTHAVDVQGNVLVTGASPTASGNNADFTTVKLSSNGIPQWTNRFISPGVAGNFLGGTGVDSAGNYYLATFGSRTFGLDFITVKYDPSGIPQWTNTFNGYASSTGNRDDEVTGLKVAPNGNILVTGFSSGGTSSFDYETLNYTHNVRYIPPTNFTGIDTLSFVAYDNLGNRATGVVTIAVLPLNLQFNTATNFQRTGAGMQLQIDGARGTNPVVISVSSDLATWQPLATNFPNLGSVIFLDSAATNAARTYYRANQLR